MKKGGAVEIEVEPVQAESILDDICVLSEFVYITPIYYVHSIKSIEEAIGFLYPKELGAIPENFALIEQLVDHVNLITVRLDPGV